MPGHCDSLTKNNTTMSETKSESRHTAATPGPWRVDPENIFSVKRGDTTVAWIGFWETDECKGQKPAIEQAANARLIACAPCMLEALQVLLLAYETTKPGASVRIQAEEKARAVIDKATGS